MLKKLFISLVIIPFILASLSACVTTSGGNNKVSISPINSLFIDERRIEDKNYKVGDTLTAYVGEPVVKKRIYLAKIQSKLAATPAMSAVLVSSDYGSISLIENKNYEVKYDVFINGVRYSAMDVPTKTGIMAVLFDSSGTIYSKVLKDGKLLPDSFKVSPLTAYVNVTRPEEIISKKMIENYEIVFGGVNNSQINMTYREYSPDDVARTAFFQELTYPTNSEFIRYKALKIKVHKTSSEGITFEVVSD